MLYYGTRKNLLTETEWHSVNNTRVDRTETFHGRSYDNTKTQLLFSKTWKVSVYEGTEIDEFLEDSFCDGEIVELKFDDVDIIKGVIKKRNKNDDPWVNYTIQSEVQKGVAE